MATRVIIFKKLVVNSQTEKEEYEPVHAAGALSLVRDVLTINNPTLAAEGQATLEVDNIITTTPYWQPKDRLPWKWAT